MDETELVDEDFLPLEEIEGLFATKVIEHKEKDPSAEKEKPKEIVLISGKREQNVSIFLRTVKRDNDEIRDAIVEMDEELLTPEVLPQMIESLPTDEERTIVTGWLKNNDDIDRLAKAERFFVEISDLKCLEGRLKAMLFKVSHSVPLVSKALCLISLAGDFSRPSWRFASQAHSSHFCNPGRQHVKTF